MPLGAHKVHFNSIVAPVVDGAVREFRKIEVAIETPVQMLEHVEIEQCGDPGSIVVSGLDDFDRFLEICADEKVFTFGQRVAHDGQECRQLHIVQIADRAAQENRHALWQRALGQAGKGGVVGSNEPPDFEGRKRGEEFAGTRFQYPRADIDWQVANLVPKAGIGVEQDAGFPGAAAAKFDQLAGAGPPGDITR